MLLKNTAKSALIAFVMFAANAAWAEGTSVAFGGLKADTTLPVEVNADSLVVNQKDGNAIFSGNVLVVQGEMRMTANEIRVEYSADGKGINKLFATGKVLLVSATDAAEADEAVYTIATGEVVLTGGVLLTQGKTAIAAERMVIDLVAGTGRMEGRVSTTFVPEGN